MVFNYAQKNVNAENGVVDMVWGSQLCEEACEGV